MQSIQQCYIVLTRTCNEKDVFFSQLSYIDTLTLAEMQLVLRIRPSYRVSRLIFVFAHMRIPYPGIPHYSTRKIFLSTWKYLLVFCIYPNILNGYYNRLKISYIASRGSKTITQEIRSGIENLTNWDWIHDTSWAIVLLPLAMISSIIWTLINKWWKSVVIPVQKLLGIMRKTSKYFHDCGQKYFP